MKKDIKSNWNTKISMRENLPPPHWSPTGNSGEWCWGEEKTGGQERECWHWHDNVYGEMTPQDITKLRQQGVIVGITTAKSAEDWTEKTEEESLLKKWWQELFK